MAISAVLAIWAPKVGPTELTVKLSLATPSFWSSAFWTSLTRLGGSFLTVIWKTLWPSFLSLICLDLRVAVAERRYRVADVRDVRGLHHRRGDSRAGLEVDAEVDAERRRWRSRPRR